MQAAGAGTAGLFFLPLAEPVVDENGHASLTSFPPEERFNA
jgi:hypothetical protein